MEQYDAIVIGASVAGLTVAAYRARRNSKQQMAGQWAFSPGGSPGAVLTGKPAANNILSTRKEQ
jgi:thioredoxin reductase